MFLNIGGDMIDVLHEGQNNTYLVKKLFGGLFFPRTLFLQGFSVGLLHWAVSRQRNDCCTGQPPGNEMIV